MHSFEKICEDFDEGYLVLDNLNEKYGNFLLGYLNNRLDNIKLTRRYLDG